MKGKGRWGKAGRDDNTKDLKNSWETTEEVSRNTDRCIHKHRVNGITLTAKKKVTVGNGLSLLELMAGEFL